MFLKNIFGFGSGRKAAEDLYAEVVHQSRQPVFYLEAEVPDTVDGRFEMISLHAFLLMRRLKFDESNMGVLSQDVFDLMFADMDQSLREIGVGDLAVGKRVKEMAKVFYGRVVSYETALDGGDEVLEEALLRNHYGTLENAPKKESVTKLADYIRRNDSFLKDLRASDLRKGLLQFSDFEEN
ncbi:MAG: ubiquinol-cytochrome C chaperone family protein [Sneathiella sp.]